MEPRDHNSMWAAEGSVKETAEGAAPDSQLAIPRPVAESAVQAALERKPSIQPPAEFARRVALLTATQPQPRPARAGGYARLTALAALVLVTLALFTLAPRAQASFGNFAFDLELAILVQLALLAWWLGRQPNRER